MRQIKLLEVNSELGAGTRGTSLGPAAIKIAALDFGSRFFKKYPTVEIPNENHLLLESSGSPFAKHISGVLTMYERICDEIQLTIENDNQFPVVLAGDHSTAGGTIAGLKKAHPKKRLGVIWIDAHSDIHSPYTSPTGNVHGMPIAASLSEDNIENKRNELDQETLNFWYQLKNVGGIAPKIKHEDIVYVGVRDFEEPEGDVIKRKKIKNISVSEFRKKGIEKTVVDVFKHLDQCDLIYVSFDVDSMDPKISQGTGTPVPGGFTDKEMGVFIARLVANQKICCFEMVEVNPTLDKENAMAEAAFEILVRAVNTIQNA